MSQAIRTKITGDSSKKFHFVTICHDRHSCTLFIMFTTQNRMCYIDESNFIQMEVSRRLLSLFVRR